MYHQIISKFSRTIKTILLSFVLGLLSACGSSGVGDGGSGGGVACAPAAGTGSITVTISSPTVVSPLVRVSGPSGYNRTLTATTTLSGITTGNYTISSDTDRVSGGGIDFLYRGSASASEVCLNNDATEAVTITYTQDPASNMLWSNGSSSRLLVGYKDALLSSSATVTASASVASMASINTRAIAFDNKGHLWTANSISGAKELLAYKTTDVGTSTAPVAVIVIRLNDASYPEGIAFDNSGNLWVADRTGGQVLKFTPAQLAASGTPVPSVTISGIPQAQALAFDFSGNLWVASQSGDYVAKFTPAQITASGSPAPVVSIATITPPPVISTITSPMSMAFDSTGNLWVLYQGSQRIVKLTPTNLSGTGSVDLTPAIQVTYGVLALPEEIAFDNFGYLWVAYGNGTSGVSLAGYSPDQLLASGSSAPSVLLTDPDGIYPNSLAFYPTITTLPIAQSD